MSTLAMYAKRIRRSLRDCRFKPSLGLDLFEEGFCLNLFGFLISLPFLDRWAYEPDEIMETWGIYYHENSVVLCWGSKTKFYHMPWDWTHIRHDVKRPDGSWAPFVGSWENGKEPDGRHVETYPYQYTLKSGEVQNREATIYVERHEWRRKFLKWTTLFAKVRVSIDVMFNGEVGERTGSWKGGTIGCGCDLKKGETPLDALRRMESEREF